MNSLSETGFKSLLATDLDGTLVGDDRSTARLFDFFEEKYRDFGLVYITGRHLASALSLIRERNLMVPDLLVSDVGAVIYARKGSCIQTSDFDLDWQRRMSRNWYPESIVEAASEVADLRRQQLPDHFRVSFTVTDAAAADLFAKKLAEACLPHTFIFSSNRDIDILPEGSGKGEALKYIIDKYTAPDALILSAGDSGNDSSMLSAGFPAVIVANAMPELSDLCSGEKIYRAKQPFAAGILEGWLHFHG